MSVVYLKVVIKKSASNYRPISITPVICRLLERIIRNAVMSHCIDNNIFSDSQYGFRNRRGCTLQLLKVLDDWTKAIDNGLPTCGHPIFRFAKSI